MDEQQRTAAQQLVDMALNEDLGDRGDITTLALGADDARTRAVIIAKQAGVLCGVDVAPLVFENINSDVHVTSLHTDGDSISDAERILELSGAARDILIAERTLLNFIGRLSGIATMTRQFVDAVAGTKAKILDTRKTTPGWRFLEKQAVCCGGGENHRIGLYDMFLIKENHIAQAGGVTAAVAACRSYMAKQRFNSQIEVEAGTVAQVAEALHLSVDRIMLDNMSLQQMRECVTLVDGRVLLEASGNVSLSRVRRIAMTGVDFISVGALTHSATVFDFSLLIAPG